MSEDDRDPERKSGKKGTPAKSLPRDKDPHPPTTDGGHTREVASEHDRDGARKQR